MGKLKGWKLFICTGVLSLQTIGAFASGKCEALFTDIQLHPSIDAKTFVEAVIKDIYGKYYQLNVKSVSPDSIKLFNILGYTNFSEKTILPSPEALTNRVKDYFPEARIEFDAVEKATIPVMEFLEYIARGQVPIGTKGQFYHDMIDHAVGFVLLARTPEWQIIVDKTAELLVEAESTGKTPNTLGKINNYLEAATPSFISEHGLGRESYAEYLEFNAQAVRRLVD